MDFCSYFIKNRALFGSYPTQKSVIELENNGVRYFINLTLNSEKKILPYQTKYNYIHYPINDNNIPTNWCSFAKFIIKISKIILNLNTNELIFLHCKGGHGRSGIVVASILCYMFNMPVEQALSYTNKYHNNRKIMKDKWRRIGSPQTKKQKNMVFKFFNELYFYRSYKCIFSNFSPYKVDVPGLGIFPTSEAAYQAHKNLLNVEYIDKQKNAKSPLFSIYIGKQYENTDDWKQNKIKIMEKIIKLKLQQHDEMRKQLLNTGFSPLVEICSCKNSFWSVDSNGKGLNMLGKILTKIRNELYESSL